MKHQDDNQTIDFLDPSGRRTGRGGRPRTKTVLTEKEHVKELAKERQAARRKRLADAGVGFMTIQVSASTLARMAELGIGKSIDKNAYVEETLRARLFAEQPAQGAEAA